MNMIRLAAVLILSAAPASAGPLAKAYMPGESAYGHAQTLQYAYNALPGGALGSRGEAMLKADLRALIPMAMTVSVAQKERLEKFIALKDGAALAALLGVVDAQARQYAESQAARFLEDVSEGKVADAQLDDAKTFAKDYLVMFGPHLDAETKSAVFKAGAELERRRLAVQERKEVKLAQVMREMSAALTDERYPGVTEPVGQPTPALAKRSDAPYETVLKRFGEKMIAALENKDKDAFRELVQASYDAFAVELEGELARVAAGLSGKDEKEAVMDLRDQAEGYHAFIKSLMKDAPDAAKVAHVRSLGNELSWTFTEDVNDSGRDHLNALIAEAQGKGSARRTDIEKMVPARAFLDAERLAATEDGSVVAPLKKILAFYEKALAKAGDGALRAEVERQLAGGFDGKVLTVQRVWEIWTAAKDMPAAQRAASGGERVRDQVGAAAFAGLVGGVATVLLALVLALNGMPAVPPLVFGTLLACLSTVVFAVTQLLGDRADGASERFRSFGRLAAWKTAANWLPWVSQPEAK